MIAGLKLKPSDKVCEIGTGSGYCTALLALLASEVVSLERFQTLALEAAARIRAFGLANVSVRWEDGFEHYKSGARYDKVIAHGLIEPPAHSFIKLMAREGTLIAAFAGTGPAEQRIVRLAVPPAGPIAVAELGPARGLRPLEPGRSRAL